MRVLWKFATLVALTGAPAGAQSAPPSAQGGDSKPQANQYPQTAPDSDKKSSPDQTSPDPPADSTKLEAIKVQKATYPYEAREQQIQGEVVVKILVSETGDVESAEVISGDPILGKSAVDAVRKWKFKPFIKNGKPVKVSTKLPIDFAFSDKVMEKGVSVDRSTTSASKGMQGLPSDSSVPMTGTVNASDVPPQRVRVASGVSQGLLIRQVAPVYPDDARRAHIQGVVMLAATINKEGRIVDLRVISGPKELAPSAIGAVQQWRYKPYVLLGQPVEVETQIIVNFKLSH